MSDAHASRFGMWIFLTSEMLLFAGLFTLYSAGRVLHPEAFAEGVEHNLRWLGSVNTVVLITSSFTVAAAVRAAEQQSRRIATVLLSVTIALGCIFLGFKTYEYSVHLAEGVAPGGDTIFFAIHDTPGLPLFFSLYYLTTGAHAVHVVIGLLVLGALMFEVQPRRIELGALYWHLVDVIWIFVWPLYYLIGGHH
jgi:cytochrome c oxidase subunit III